MPSTGSLQGMASSSLTRKSSLSDREGLVGAPLTAMWRASGYDVDALDITSEQIDDTLRRADIIVAAAGSPRLIRPEVVKDGAVVVDAGTTTENGVLVGDVDDAVRERDDVMITPKKGGVGPLTVALLFGSFDSSVSRSHYAILRTSFTSVTTWLGVRSALTMYRATSRSLSLAGLPLYRRSVRIKTGTCFPSSWRESFRAPHLPIHVRHLDVE